MEIVKHKTYIIRGTQEDFADLFGKRNKHQEHLNGQLVSWLGVRATSDKRKNTMMYRCMVETGVLRGYSYFFYECMIQGRCIFV